MNATSYRALSTGSKMVWNSATDLFAALGPREYYRTAGMIEVVLSTAGDLSYRKAVALFNRAP